MKKLFLLCCLLTLPLFASEGEKLFKKCAVCHGKDADKVYLNKIPPLIKMDKDERLKAMEKYKSNSRNKYGMGVVMNLNVKDLSKDQLKEIEEYIEKELK